MKLIIATIFALMVCGSALGADANDTGKLQNNGFWKCQKSDGTTVYQDFDCSLNSKPVVPKQLAPEPVKPNIGMTSSEAENLAWPWGKAKDINTTTTARGTREQWVFEGHRYLYFENGILTAISN